MYARNHATPETIAIGPVVQISDGAVQTAGCTVRIIPDGVAEGDGGGTTAYSTDGVVLYTPTQAETNYTSFLLIAKKTGCIPTSITVVTTASATNGNVVLSGETHTSAVIPSVTTVTGNVDGSVGSLTGHTVQTGDSFALANGAAGFAAIDTNVDTLIANQGDWATATGFSTHAATDIVSAGAITTLTGAVVNVDLVDTITTYTGNTLQTGDTFALANGATGFTAIDTVVDAILVDTADMQPKLGTPAADIAADVAAVKAETALVVADTNELQADDYPTLIAAVDTVVDALATTLGTAGAGLTDLGGMSTGMIAEVNAASDAAFVTYDGPTKTELDTGLGLLATEAKQDIIDTVVDGIQTDLSNGTDGLGALKALIDTVDSEVGDILLDTAEIGTAGAGLTNVTLANDLSSTMKASVQTAVDAAIDTAINELAVAAPTATPTLRTGLMLLYMALRNKLVVQTSGTDALELYNDAGIKIASKAITDDTSDYTEAEMS